MATVRPFCCIRPNKEVVSKVAALPYDVYNREEAKAVAADNPLSFLNIDRAETQFPDEVSLHDPRVYEKAHELLEGWIADGTLVADETECYYIYELTMDGRAQTGIVACAAVDDYMENVIKRHESTREEKELDRICHVDVTDAHTGPIFLAYRSDEEMNRMVGQACEEEALYDFVAEDGVRHRVWKVASPELIEKMQTRFAKIPSLYIADGHHRAASAVKVGLKRRDARPYYTGEEPFNYFLSVLFPDDQLMIMPYNRVVRDLNGYGKEAFLQEVAARFTVTPLGKARYQPKERHEFGMYLDGDWYALRVNPEFVKEDDPVKGLDVSILQDVLLGPVLGIKNPRTDERIDFIGGIRGLSELERRVSEDMEVAFSMYPTSIRELFAVADDGFLMPPKSTWFEPKLRSGLFIHRLT